MGFVKEWNDTMVRVPVPTVTHEVVHTAESSSRVVHRGALMECEDWLALHGDLWHDGSFEIRPVLSENPTS